MIWIIGRFLTICTDSKILSYDVWRGAISYRTHYTEQCIEVRPYCSISWNLYYDFSATANIPARLKLPIPLGITNLS